MEIERRAGTPEKPILRLAGHEGREAAEALRGAPALRAGRGGARARGGRVLGARARGLPVVDGERAVGEVRRMLPLPSCEALEVARADGGGPARPDGARRDPLGRRRGAPHRRRPRLPRRCGRLRPVQIDVFTLFPGWFDWFRTQRHVTQRGGARLVGRVRRLPRAHAAEVGPGRRHAVRRRRGDGPARRRRRGRAARALRRRPDRGARRGGASSRSPRAGGCSTTALVEELAAEQELTLLCGRYEGFDERILDHFCTDQLSIGRYVLAGGELAAMVVADAVLRKLPGALGHEESAARGVLLGALDGRAGVPALHAARGVARLGGARGAAQRPSRPDPRMAPRAVARIAPAAARYP